MKVFELIKKLEAMPADALVLVNGYEGGYTPPTEISLQGVYIDMDNMNSDYFGNYETDGPATEQAVIFERGQ